MHGKQRKTNVTVFIFANILTNVELVETSFLRTVLRVDIRFRRT